MEMAEALVICAIGESCCIIADGGHGISACQADAVNKATQIMVDEGYQRPGGILLLAVLYLLTHHRQKSANYLGKVGEMLVEKAPQRSGAHRRV